MKESFYLVSPDLPPKFCGKCKWLEKIAPVINFYSIPFVSKSYDYILQTWSSNSFWAHFGTTLLNFLKILFFFLKKKKEIVKPSFCHFCELIDILPILRNQGYRHTPSDRNHLSSRGMQFQ